jgi:hypothetical protein
MHTDDFSDQALTIQRPIPGCYHRHGAVGCAPGLMPRDALVGVER